MPMASPLEERTRFLRPSEQVVGDGEARDAPAKEDLDLLTNGFRRHLSTVLLKHGKDRTANGAELPPTVRPTGRRRDITEVLVLVEGRERMRQET